MAQSRAARLAACILVAAMAASCSRGSAPPVRDVRVIESQEADPELAASKAHEECQGEARKSRLRSVIGLLRPSRTERRYIECMRERGFEPRQPQPDASPNSTQSADLVPHS